MKETLDDLFCLVAGCKGFVRVVSREDWVNSRVKCEITTRGVLVSPRV